MRTIWWVLLIPKVINYVFCIGLAAGVLAMILYLALCDISERIFKKKFDRFIKAVLILAWIITVTLAVIWYIRKLNSLSYEMENLKPWAAVLMFAGTAFMYLIAWGMWSSIRSDKKETDSEEAIETNSPDTAEEQTALSEISNGEEAN